MVIKYVSENHRSIRIQKCQEFLLLTVKIHTVRDQNHTPVEVRFASGYLIASNSIVEI